MAPEKVYPSAETVYGIGRAVVGLATALGAEGGKRDLASVFVADEALWRLLAEVEPADPLEGVPHAGKLRKADANRARALGLKPQAPRPRTAKTLSGWSSRVNDALAHVRSVAVRIHQAILAFDPDDPAKQWSWPGLFEVGLLARSGHALCTAAGKAMGRDRWIPLREVERMEHAARVLRTEAGKVEADGGGSETAEEYGEEYGEGYRKEPPSEWIFAPSGDGYDIAGFGEHGHFKSIVGFEYLEKLLKNAGKPVLMVELVGTGQDDRIDADRHSRQEVLDEETKEAVREQLRELEEEIARAKRYNDHAELQRLEGEKEELLAYLRGAMGLGNRDRDMNDPINKLRWRITNALKRAYEALRQAESAMTETADHFQLSISSEGSTFKYDPKPSLLWSVDSNRANSCQ